MPGNCPRRPKQLVGAVMAAMAGFANPRLSLDCGVGNPLLLSSHSHSICMDAIKNVARCRSRV